MKLCSYDNHYTKRELEMFVVSYTNVSVSFILALNKIHEKKYKIYFLTRTNINDDVANLEVCVCMENINIEISWEKDILNCTLRTTLW